MSTRVKDRRCEQIERPPSRIHDLDRLRRRQERIAARIVLEDRFRKPVERVAGFDVAYLDERAVASAVTMDYDTFEVIEERTLRSKVSFPYIRTFLGFREGPLIIRLARRLKSEPDVLMVNSHGIAHPCFCGCASHIGVSLGKPTIGVAGSRLCGEYEVKPERAGDWAPLRYQERIVGAVLLAKEGCRPIFVSAGHMVTLETAIDIVKHFLTIHRFPEPIGLAHQLANRAKKMRLT